MKKNLKGTVVSSLLIIVTAFLIAIYGILYILFLQFNYAGRQVNLEQALNIAEAGVNYYRWHLAHDPNDFQDGTGETKTYEHEYTDPQGKAIGKFELNIGTPSAGSSLVTIRSTGYTYQHPNIKRTVSVQYGQQSFARYSFLQHYSTWYGPGITVNGLVHSNNGIRMDGTNTSLVTSNQSTYVCGSETGCYSFSYCQSPCNWSSNRCNCPGVWGAGGDKGLWQYPETYQDFSAISFNLEQMRTSAISQGLYLEPSGSAGYHIIFNLNGTFNVYKVTGTSIIYGDRNAGIGSPGGCRALYQTITNENLIGTYNVVDKPLVFVQDFLWIEGTLKGRITVASASLSSSMYAVWIKNSLSYTTYDGSDVLGLISQNDIYFAKNIPNDFKVDAVLMAQNGTIIRHRYYSGCGGSSGAIKNSLTINGCVISYEKSYWNYGSPVTSGFQTRQVNYDANVLYAPPPHFPTSGEYEFISWMEEKN